MVVWSSGADVDVQRLILDSYKPRENETEEKGRAQPSLNRSGGWREFLGGRPLNIKMLKTRAFGCTGLNIKGVIDLTKEEKGVGISCRSPAHTQV